MDKKLKKTLIRIQVGILKKLSAFLKECSSEVDLKKEDHRKIIVHVLSEYYESIKKLFQLCDLDIVSLKKLLKKNSIETKEAEDFLKMFMKNKYPN